MSITSVESKRIRSEEVTQLKGNWQLKRVGTQEQIGPQEGSGELIGSIDKGEIDINLNPNISDANVYLHGTIEGRRFHGTWGFEGYAGAVKVPSRRSEHNDMPRLVALEDLIPLSQVLVGACRWLQTATRLRRSAQGCRFGYLG